MQRLVVLGRGGAGKSTVARTVSAVTGLPLTELDSVFWPPDLTPLPKAEWAARQRALVAAPAWILDGDLGPFDVLEPRLRECDTVVILDFSLPRCAWRALRRSREPWVFWRWLLTYRRESLPQVLDAVTEFAPHAAVHRLRDPAGVRRFLAAISVDPPGDGRIS